MSDSNQHSELVERIARGLRAGHEFINELPLTDGASPRAKDREFVTVTLIPDGLVALHRLEEQLQARELPCQKCGGENPVWWVEDSIWNRVVGTTDNPRGEGVILCPSCFSRRILEQLQTAQIRIETQTAVIEDQGANIAEVVQDRLRMKEQLEAAQQEQARLVRCLAREQEIGSNQLGALLTLRESLELIARGEKPADSPAWTTGKSWRIELARAALASVSNPASEPERKERTNEGIRRGEWGPKLQELMRKAEASNQERQPE